MSLYWLLILPRLGSMSAVILTAAFILYIGFLVAWVFQYTDDPPPSKEDLGMYSHSNKIFLILFFVCGVVCILCPSRLDLAIMMGWDGIQSDTIQDVIELLKRKFITACVEGQ